MKNRVIPPIFPEFQLVPLEILIKKEYLTLEEAAKFFKFMIVLNHLDTDANSIIKTRKGFFNGNHKK